MQKIREHAVNNFSESVFFQQIAKVLEQFCGHSVLHNLKINSEWLANKVVAGAEQ